MQARRDGKLRDVLECFLEDDIWVVSSAIFGVSLLLVCELLTSENLIASDFISDLTSSVLEKKTQIM